MHATAAVPANPQTEASLTATFNGGRVGTAATATWTIDGVDLTLTADTLSADPNVSDVALIPTHTTVPGAGTAVSADTPVVVQPDGSTLRVHALPDVATHRDVVNALAAADGVSASLDGASAVIDLYRTTTSGGAPATPATATLTIEGEAIDITAATPGVAGNDHIFSVIGTAEGDDGTDAATPVAISEDSNRVSVFAVAATATHQDVVDAIDALSGWSATLAPGATSQTLVLAEEDFGAGWTKQGDTSGNWVVDGVSVEQTVNGNATYYINDTTATAVTLNTTLTVSDVDDDDIGVVVGWVDADNHIVFRWSGGGLQGLAGTHRSLEIKDATNGDRSLAADNVAWVRDQSYAVSVQYAPNTITVLVDGTVVFDVDAADVAGVSTFPAGQYGLFNQSQPGTTYESLRTGAEALSFGGQDATGSQATLTVPTSAGSATLAVTGPAAATEVVLDASQSTAATDFDAATDTLVVDVPGGTSVDAWRALIDNTTQFSASLASGVGTDTLALVRRATLTGGTDPAPAAASLTLASGRVVFSDDDVARNGQVVEVIEGCNTQIVDADADGRLTVTLRAGVDGFNDLAALIEDSGVGVAVSFVPDNADAEDPLLSGPGSVGCEADDTGGSGGSEGSGDAPSPAEAADSINEPGAAHPVPVGTPGGLWVLISLVLGLGVFARLGR
jgi:hypothetical protein